MALHIRITCEGAATVPYMKIKGFQGDLKDISKEDYQRLKKQILKHGFNSPIHVWKNKNQLWNMDGHQRHRVLSGLEDEDYKIPDIPIDYIKAKNLAEAKRILLSRVSQYGKVTALGLHAYMADANLSIDDVKGHFAIPDLDLEKFDQNFFQLPKKKEHQETQEIGMNDQSSKLIHECPRCHFRFGRGVPNA